MVLHLKDCKQTSLYRFTFLTPTIRRLKLLLSEISMLLVVKVGLDYFSFNVVILRDFKVHHETCLK